ncbi:hypothetical protein D3C75_793880 [compost metagenome]
MVLPRRVHREGASKALEATQHICRTTGRDVVQVERENVAPQHRSSLTAAALKFTGDEAADILQVVLL